MGSGATGQVIGGPPDITDVAEADGEVAEILRRLSEGFNESANQLEGLFIGSSATGQVTGGSPDIADVVEADGEVTESLRRLSEGFNESAT